MLQEMQLNAAKKEGIHNPISHWKRENRARFKNQFPCSNKKAMLLRLCTRNWIQKLKKTYVTIVMMSSTPCTSRQ